MIYIFIITLLLVLSSTVGGETNVGTVLFTRSDAVNETWPRSKLALLKARLYTQHLIPPLATPQTPEFVDALLTYFQDCYTTISQESKDTQTELILTTAFTDVVGGYLKMFALPLTKYGYYGGTLPKQDAIKLFLFYEDVKNYLGKSDASWAEPALPILKSMTINIAVPPFTSSRSNSLMDPCQQMSYFQRTPQGLDVPIPIIDWNTLTMFIPLSDQSLVNLYSSNISNALHTYYDVAVNCVRSMKPSNLNSFNERFQSWLKREVVPHLSDNLLYTALEGVLGLVNDTDDLTVHAVYVTYAVADRDHHTMSTKMIIVLVIVAIELVWCLPILACMLYRRIKKRRDRDRMTILETRYGPRSCCEFYDGGELQHFERTVCPCGGKCGRCSPCLLEVTAMMNDSSKKMSGTQTKSIHSISTSTRMSGADEFWRQQVPSDVTIKTTYGVQCPSKTTTVRLPRSNLKKTGDANVDSCLKCSPVYISKVNTKRPSKCQTMKTIVTTARAEAAHLERECSKKDVVEPQNEPAVAEAPTTIKPVKRARRSNKSLKAAADEKCLQSEDEAFLEIRIDRPRREISFDVSRHGEVKKVINKPRKSKIPRSIGTSPRMAVGTASGQSRRQGSVQVPRLGSVPPPRPESVPVPRPRLVQALQPGSVPPPRENRGKSLIPKPKWATDDIALLRDVGTKTPKLNVTL